MFVDAKGGCLIDVKVKVQKPQTRIVAVEDNFISVELRAKPLQNEANEELERFLSRLLGTSVRIVRGFKSKTKLVFVSGMIAEDCAKVILNSISR